MAVDLSVEEDEMDQGNSYLREGYIGPVDLVSIEKDEVGDDEIPVLQFTFEAQDEDHIGQRFEHTEWPISEDDLETVDANGTSNAELELRRLVHTLSRVLAVDQETLRENVVRFQGETVEEAWESLRTRVVQAYQKFGESDADLHAKAYARERNGYVNVQFPNYPPFLRVLGEDPKLEFSAWEREQNREASEFLASDPDSGDEFAGEDDDFDFDDAEF